MMWILFACGSAFFAGITAVLAKIGMEHINSTVATALRTVIVLVFSWFMVLLTGAFSEIGTISGKTLLFYCYPDAPLVQVGCIISKLYSLAMSTKLPQLINPVQF